MMTNVDENELTPGQRRALATARLQLRMDAGLQSATDVPVCRNWMVPVEGAISVIV